MTTFEKIVNAIEIFGYPYSPGVYSGPEERWFTYNYAADVGANYADDAPGSVIVSVQVHLFLPIGDDFQEIKNDVRRALFAEGFTFSAITILTEDDTKIRHIVCECEIEEEEP